MNEMAPTEKGSGMGRGSGERPAAIGHYSATEVAFDTPRPHIQVDPDRLSGRPTIRGRRVPTAMVAELAEQPDGRALLGTEFGLTEEEIEQAVEYEADVEKAFAA